MLELLREEQSLTQVAAQYGVRPNLPRRWRQIAIEQLPELFAGDSAPLQPHSPERLVFSIIVPHDMVVESQSEH